MSELESASGSGSLLRPSVPAAELEELESALAAAFPGIELFDRELRVDGRHVAELVVRDADRISLVLLVDGRSELAAMHALDTLAFLSRSSAVLLAHLELAAPVGVQPEAFSLFLVASSGFSPRALERLAGLGGGRLRLFERRRLESERGTTLLLEELVLPGAAALPAAAPTRPEDAEPFSAALHDSELSSAEPYTAGAFLEGLPSELRALSGELIARLARIDTRIELRPSPGRLSCNLEGTPLCQLVSSGDRLEGHLAGSGVPHRIHSRAAAEVFLDWVLAMHLERLDSEEAPELEDYELVPAVPAPLLTREEIEAFHTGVIEEAGSLSDDSSGEPS